MPDHDITAVLAHHLGSLDADACAALVADLWTARGFETSRDGTTVVATSGGTDRRIHVGRPSEPETVEPPDLVVSLRSDRRARAAARTAGATFLDAAGLAEMVRYAVDRGTAAALCERHLGSPPEHLRPPLGARLRARLDGFGGATPVDVTDRATGSRSVSGAAPVFGLVLVLLFGAVAGVALTGTPGTGTDGASGVEPVADPSVVPGLTDDGVADLSTLAAAHARSLRGRSYSLWMDTYRPSAGFPDGRRVQFDTDVTVSGGRFLVEENVGDGGERQRLRTIYYDGADWYGANETAGETTISRLPRFMPPPSPTPDEIARSLVTDYLSTPETSVEGRVEREVGNEGSTLYRVVGRGVPPTMDDEPVRNYTAVALVDRNGLVRDLTVTYTLEGDDGTDRIRKEWTYGDIDVTVVDPPAWYEERFASNATATPSPSPTPTG